MSTEIEELSNLNLNDVRKFTFKDTKTYGRVVSVYDADTITLAFKFGDQYHSFSIRISGIDSPEIKSHNKKESTVAKAIRDKLSNLILNKVVYAEIYEYDKYGRLLADVYVLASQECVNEDIEDMSHRISISEILKQGNAVRTYTQDNLHKDVWTDDELDNIYEQIKNLDLNKYYTFETKYT